VTKHTTSWLALGFTGTDRTPGERWRKSNRNGDWAMRGCIALDHRARTVGCKYGLRRRSPRRRAQVVLLVAWLAWSRYRVVIALRDRTAPSVFAGLDRIFRIVGGARPTY